MPLAPSPATITLPDTNTTHGCNLSPRVQARKILKTRNEVESSIVVRTVDALRNVNTFLYLYTSGYASPCSGGHEMNLPFPDWLHSLFCTGLHNGM